jgi:hypothetical protein
MKKIIICLLLLSSSSVAMQSSDKLWSSFTLEGNYGGLVYQVEPQLRLVYDNHPFQQFLNNSGMGYQIKPAWQLWVGQTFSADSQDAVAGSLDEYRLWEQIVWNHQIDRTQIFSRTRIEERKSLFFAEWAYRIRERIAAHTAITKNISFVMSDEIFFNLNHANWITTQTLDQNRAYIGIEQALSENKFLSVGYLNQYLSTKNTQFNSVLMINFRIQLPEK